jgi:DNA processing protein
MRRDEERIARAALSRACEPGDIRVAAMVAEFGALDLVDRLRRGDGLSGVFAAAAARLATCDPETELAQARRLGARFVIPGDEEWPVQLDNLADAEPLNDRGGIPHGLWVRGPVRLDSLSASVAVVGSRAATTYGGQLARDLAFALAEAASPVVSGAAFGIDQAAHRGALAAGGPTVAVLACGVDRAYPKAHAPLLEHLYAHGVVVSETPLGGAPQRIRFLARNRLIAAITRGTVVVEAAVRSGALNTANWASRLNRPVMGVPGPVTSAASGGVHQLIRLHGAELVTNGAEVLEMVGAAGEHLVEPPRGPVHARDGLSLKHQQVLDAVPVANGAPEVSIARVAGLATAEVVAALGHLSAVGLVEVDDEGWRLAALAHP